MPWYVYAMALGVSLWIFVIIKGVTLKYRQQPQHLRSLWLRGTLLYMSIWLAAGGIFGYVLATAPPNIAKAMMAAYCSFCIVKMFGFSKGA